MGPLLLAGVAVVLAITWVALRIRSHRVRKASDLHTTWDERARGLPNSTYTAVVSLAAISILGVAVCVRGGPEAPLGVAVSVIAAIAAAGLRRQSFSAQYAADSAEVTPDD